MMMWVGRPPPEMDAAVLAAAAGVWPWAAAAAEILRSYWTTTLCQLNLGRVSGQDQQQHPGGFGGLRPSTSMKTHRSLPQL
jgi:hypothetical protein